MQHLSEVCEWPSGRMRSGSWDESQYRIAAQVSEGDWATAMELPVTGRHVGDSQGNTELYAPL